MFTTARSKVKSMSDDDVAHLNTHTHTHTPTRVPTKYQLLSPYGFRDISWTRYETHCHYVRVKDQIKVIIKKNNKNSGSHNDVAHLHPAANVPTRFQLPTRYGFLDTARTNFFPATHPSGHHGWKPYPDGGKIPQNLIIDVLQQVKLLARTFCWRISFEIAVNVTSLES